MVFIPTEANLASNSDWMVCGTFENKRKTTIDPSTGANLEKATVKLSAGVKNGDSKAFSFKITGVSHILVTLASTSSTSARYGVAKVIEDGTNDEQVYVTEAATAVSSSILSFPLDENKRYTISLFGQKEGSSVTEKFSGDIAVFGVTFIKTESLTTANSTFSTYAASYPVNYSEIGLDVYAVILDEVSKKVSYVKVDGSVPANTPVLVKGGISTAYVLQPAKVGSDIVATDLQASDGTIVGDGSTIYAFGTKNGVSGFKLVGNGVKVPAKKGYLKLSSSAAAKDFFAFGDETTGISNISANGIDEEETPLFNLAGQRVDKNYKGVVVKNGKKFVNK